MLRPLGVAYIVSILASLLVAVTITPVLCHRLLPPAAAASKGGSWLMRTVTGVYAHVLDWTLPRPRLVVATVVLLLAGTLAIIPILGRSFLPRLPGGVADNLRREPPGDLARRGGRDRHSGRATAAGASWPWLPPPAAPDGPSWTSTPRRPTPPRSTPASTSPITNWRRSWPSCATSSRGLPGTNVTIGQPIGHRIDHMLSGTRAAIAANLFGPDLAQLRELAAAVEAVADEVPGLVDVAADQQAEVPPAADPERPSRDGTPRRDAGGSGQGGRCGIFGAKRCLLCARASAHSTWWSGTATSTAGTPPPSAARS